MTKILCVGIATLDCIFTVSNIPTSADKFIASACQWVVGGCAANAALAIQRLGGKAYLSTQIGDDLAGNFISSSLQAEGIDFSRGLRHQGGHTPLSSIFVDSKGERQIVNYRGGAGVDYSTGDVNCTYSGNLDVAAILADTRWPGCAERAFRLAQSKGIPRVLDAESPIPNQLMQLATHVAFSRSGLMSLGYGNDLETALLEAANRLPNWCCVTDGANGVYVAVKNHIEHHPAFSVSCVDTLGAGDVWHGAFCLHLANGYDETDSIMYANAVAALKCTRKGGGSATPNDNTVKAFVESQIN